MTQEELINKIKEAQKEFFDQNPCKFCVGSGCDDCRDCDYAPLRYELSSKVFKLKEEFKKLYNVEYDDYINNQKSQSQNSLNKELLLKDISARLPYNPMVEYKGETYNVLGITSGRLILCKPFMSCALNEHPLVEEVKPYLFPMSSMTEEQYNDFFAYFHNAEINEIKTSGDYLKAAYIGENAKREWLNKNHFDYNYHIEKGLVLDATGLNIY